MAPVLVILSLKKNTPPPSLSQPNVYMQPFSEIDHKYDLNKTNSSILTHIPFWPIIPQRCRHGLFYTWDKGKMTAKLF